MNDQKLSRRRFVAAAGTAGVGAGLAGCSGTGDDDGGNGGTGDDTATPTDASGGDRSEAETRLVEFLNANPAAGNFEGNVVDATGNDEVVVEVGTQGNGGDFAYTPPAVTVSTGTAISWQWTDGGSSHNVESVSDSDFDFRSGASKVSGDPYEQSFDEAGVGLYVCTPHRSLGMKGGFVVVE